MAVSILSEKNLGVVPGSHQGLSHKKEALEKVLLYNALKEEYIVIPNDF